MDFDRRQFNGALIATLFMERGWHNPQELADCPKGFQWTRSELLQSWLLLPEGWYVHDVDHDGFSKSVLLAPEPDERLAIHATHFMINVARDLEGDMTEFCENVLATVTEDVDRIVKRFGDANFPLVSRGAEYVEFLDGTGNSSQWDPEGEFDPDIGQFENKDGNCYRVCKMGETDEDSRSRIDIIGNEETGTLYIAQFSSALENWSRDWQIGKTIYDALRINQTV